MTLAALQYRFILIDSTPQNLPERKLPQSGSARPLIGIVRTYSVENM